MPQSEVSKSFLFGVNVGRPFLYLDMDFLHCKVCSLPFKYLELLVGANSKKEWTWDPFVKLVSKILVYSRNRFVSLGEWMVLLNSISMFFLSFMKMSVLVWKKLVDLPKVFPLGGSKERAKVVWVKRGDVCKD